MKQAKGLLTALVFVGAASVAVAADPATTTTTTATQGVAGTTLTDGQIIHIMEKANEGEADIAKMAKGRAENKDVKEFAKKMADEHKKSEKAVKDVAKKIKVKAVENDASKTIENTAEAKEKDLKKLKGKEFDKAYIDTQVSMHQQLLKDLTEKMIPAAQNAELKSYLETTKGHVESHLARAQEIQNALQ